MLELTIRQLAKKYVTGYRQGNPFADSKKFTQFNIAYKEELEKFFLDKPQSYYSEYYQEVSRLEKYQEVRRLEKENGQLLMV